MFLLGFTLLFVLLMLVFFLIFFIYKIWRNEGWRHGLNIIAYFILSYFLLSFIFHYFNILKEPDTVTALTIVFLAAWAFGLFIYVRWNEY